MKKIKSEIRKSYLLDKYAIITPGRAARPREIKEQTVIKDLESCPFCPENIDRKKVIDKLSADSSKGEGWDVLSIKNIFPAVELNNKKAYGTQEVIVETPNHAEELGEIKTEKIEQLLKMYAKRTKDIAKNKKINYILCFKNQGSKAGASIAHSHSQIFATKITPPEIKEEMMAINDYKRKHGSCPYCKIIKKEAKSERKIFSDKNIVAFTPYASEYHYEAWIFPRKHVDNITLLTEDEIKSFAKALKLILEKLETINLSFNYFLHNLVSDKNQHLYLKIQPRDSVWAGVELGSGLIINSVPPEEAAKFYRN
jgi:UDPglucose--hexose-1-phosphate uridylyltransferase